MHCSNQASSALPRCCACRRVTIEASEYEDSVQRSDGGFPSRFQAEYDFSSLSAAKIAKMVQRYMVFVYVPRANVEAVKQAGKSSPPLCLV